MEERKEKGKEFLILFPQGFPRKGKKKNIPLFLPSSTPSPGGKSPEGAGLVRHGPFQFEDVVFSFFCFMDPTHASMSFHYAEKPHLSPSRTGQGYCEIPN
jgi:hypothetical protein